MSSVFSGIEKAEVFGRASRIRPGRHRIRIAEVLVKRSVKSATTFLIVEGEIVSSEGGRPMTARELPAGQKAPLSDPHTVGEAVSWIVDLGKPNGLSNVKGFALGLAPDATEADITEASMLAIVNQDPKLGQVQPCAGLLVDCEAIMILTVKKGDDFTAVSWIAVEQAAA